MTSSPLRGPEVGLITPRPATRKGFEDVVTWLRSRPPIMVARDAVAAELAGRYLTAIPIFDLDVVGGDVRLKARAPYTEAAKTANFTLDAKNGGAQVVPVASNVTLTGIDNLVGPEPINVLFQCGSSTLTLDDTVFQGPTLSFTGTAAFSFVDFGDGKITAMGSTFTSSVIPGGGAMTGVYDVLTYGAKGDGVKADGVNADGAKPE